MRNHCTTILKKQFRIYLIQSRAVEHISQEEMARRLVMSTRSYADAEHGKSCGAVTLALYLAYVCPDPMAFLEDLRMALDSMLEVV